MIDGYFQEVIASPKLGPEDNEIQLHPDGSWSTLSNKAGIERESPKKLISNVEVIEDDLGEETKCVVLEKLLNLKHLLHRTHN